MCGVHPPAADAGPRRPPQGIFLDTDGTLIGAAVCANLGGDWCSAGPPGPAFLPLNGLLRPGECDWSDAAFAPATAVRYAVCKPGLVHRRVMLNGHGPETLEFNALNVTAWDDGNKWYMDSIPFSKYNDNGYQFAAIVNRNYELSWNTAGGWARGGHTGVLLEPRRLSLVYSCPPVRGRRFRRIASWA